MGRPVTCLGLFVFSLAFLPASRATTIHVPNEQPTIQAGIDLAAAGDTVLVEPGIYIENIDYGNSNITVGSHYLISGDTTHVESTVIEAALSSVPVVTIAGAQPRETWLCGFTITGATPPNGCGVYCNASSPTIDHNIIRENIAEEKGAGIRIVQGGPAVQHNRILGNTTENLVGHFGGAGVYSMSASPEITHNRIVNNSVCPNGSFGGGGGICAMYGAPVISHNVIGLNDAGERGGGIHCEGSEPIITDNEIFSNLVRSYNGGGIASKNCAAVIECNLIYGNSGASYGGGIFY